MDLEVLKKKLSSFRGEGGRLTNVSDEILLEIPYIVVPPHIFNMRFYG